MKMISSKSKVILAKIGIPIYVKRDNLGQNFMNTIILHKRDKILARSQITSYQAYKSRTRFVYIDNEYHDLSKTFN